jgi:hypothetical protein
MEPGDVKASLGNAGFEPDHQGLAVEDYCLGGVVRFGAQYTRLAD